MGIKKAFTFVELVVSIGVISFMLPALFAIIFTLLNQQIVLQSLQETKRQGDTVQTTFHYLLQNRVSKVVDQTTTCPLLPLPTPTFFPRFDAEDREGRAFSLYRELIAPYRIASLSGTIYYLTSPSVDTANVGFTCYRTNSFSPPVVTVQYVVQKTSPMGIVSLPYFFKVQLRNYK